MKNIILKGGTYEYGLNKKSSKNYVISKESVNGYKTFLANIAMESGTFAIRYILENSIGNFTVSNDGNYIQISFDSEDPDRLGSTNMSVSINNLFVGGNNEFRIHEFYGNSVYLSVLNPVTHIAVTDITNADVYECFLEVRFYTPAYNENTVLYPYNP